MSSDEETSIEITPEVARVKRKLKATQDELELLKGNKKAKNITNSTLGRQLCRTVDLVLKLDTYVIERDHRVANQIAPFGSKVGDVEINEPDPRRRDRDYEAYTLVCAQIQGFERRVDTENSVKLLYQFYKEVSKFETTSHSDGMTYFVDLKLEHGGNQARAEDILGIRQDLAKWLNKDPIITTNRLPLLDGEDRKSRGFYHELTGRLLCPIEYDWSDPDVRQRIRSYELDCHSSFFVNCLYKAGKGDPDAVEEGFLRNGYLVKTYQRIFTSPSSSRGAADNIENDEPLPAPDADGQDKKASKKCIAQALGMSSVTPRSIAYAAVMLHFNLTNASHWVLTHNNFNYEAFYKSIVDYLEVPGDEEGVRAVNDLFGW
ncbi:hypothetical protein EYR38_006755 [Pleurotus pulmonarius]|nr:hypothetical protein EYR38_006755 [Pleurotus pulmonarius]